VGEFEVKVFITTTNASCSECGEELGRSAWITLVEGKGAPPAYRDAIRYVAGQRL
jgi:hypothetical protein